MTRLFRAFAVACPLALAGAAADAATFNFTDHYRNPTNSFSMTSDGITMTVYGGYYGGGYGTVRTHQGYGLSVGYHMIDGHERRLQDPENHGRSGA